MDMKLKEDFLKRWKKYFNGAELPIAFFYSNQTGSSEPVSPGTGALSAIWQQCARGNRLLSMQLPCPAAEARGISASLRSSCRISSISSPAG